MDVTFFENTPYFSKTEIQGENTRRELQFWSWDSLLDHPEMSPSIQPQNADVSSPVQIPPNQPASPVQIPLNQPETSPSSPDLVPEAAANPHNNSSLSQSSPTKELQVYTRRKKQPQGEMENLAHLMPVHESEPNPMTTETNTRGGNEPKQDHLRLKL